MLGQLANGGSGHGWKFIQPAIPNHRDEHEHFYLSLLFLSAEIPFQLEGRYPKSLIGKNFCAYLLELRNSSTSFKGIRKALIDTLLDGYESARYGTGVSAGGALLALQGIPVLCPAAGTEVTPLLQLDVPWSSLFVFRSLGKWNI